jgi:ATPase subunit of ABC transporter with duplicated ATPase domains
LTTVLYTGKTSLLNLLVGDAEPTTGKVSRHLGCRIARLQQHHYKGEQLDPNLTPLVRDDNALGI